MSTISKMAVKDAPLNPAEQVTQSEAAEDKRPPGGVEAHYGGSEENLRLLTVPADG